MKNVQIELGSHEPLNIGLLLDEQYGIIFFLTDKQLSKVIDGNETYYQAEKKDVNRIVKNYLETFRWEKEYLYISLAFPSGKALKPSFSVTRLTDYEKFPIKQGLKDFIYKYDGSSIQANKLTYDFQMYARQLQGIK